MNNALKALIAGSVGGGPLLATLASSADVIGSIWSKERSNKMNKEINEKNLDFAKEQFQYQKYLNNNQFQIQSADAQKAGINPLAMTAGSLNGGSYSNSSNPMESVYNGGLGNLIAEFANIANQKEMNSKTNETNKTITDANNQNQKDIAILKILADKDIATGLNEHQKDMLLAELSSKEKIASNELAESQKVLNSATASHYKKMDYINEVNSAVENYIKDSKNNYLKEQLKIQQGYLREAIRDNDTKRAKMIIDGINQLLSTAVSAINPLSKVFSSGSSNKIGF